VPWTLSKTRALPVALLACVALSLVAAPAASANFLIPDSGGSPNADKIQTLYILIAVFALIIFIGVEGLLIYSLIRYRARRGRVAAQIHGNTQLEIGWTVGAAVLLVFITVATFVMLPGIKNPAASEIDAQGNPVAARVQYASTDQPAPPRGSAAMNIGVNGQQYSWRFQYPGRERVFSWNTMYVPVGMTITLDITAVDVVHSWWIPPLGGKMDAVPGYTNKSWFRIPVDAIGEGERQVVFRGQCAELCGRNHANMLARVVGLPYDEWRRWYQNKAREIQEANDAAEQRRSQEQSE
jgi:cytochrome c oxidase subunit 2